MSNDDLVSIIIPVYNSEKYISRCLDSVICQTYRNIEIIVINDGSKDDSLKILKSYSKKYSFIHLYDQNNQGVANTRNNALKYSNGKYIMFIDNDDYIDKDYVDTYVRIIKQNNSDLVIGGYKRVSDKKVLFSVKPNNSDWVKYTIVAPWAKIYKAKVLKDNNIKFLNYGIGEDSYFSVLLYSKTKNISYINYTGYNWYYNKSSISNSSQRGFNSNIDLIYLLDKLIGITGSYDIMYQYYYIRYIIWYLLFSGKTASPEEFYKEYKRLFLWLGKNKIRVRYPIFSTMFKGEGIKRRIVIKLFVILHKLNLVNLFSKLYCK